MTAVVQFRLRSLSGEPPHNLRPPQSRFVGRAPEIKSLHELLVVLDNCEHVVESAAEVAVALLQECPNIRKGCSLQ